MHARQLVVSGCLLDMVHFLCQLLRSWHACDAAPLHMAMWGHGRVDEEEGSIIDAIVAIPEYTLHMAGLIGLPKDYMMQISARGSAFRPVIDWFK